MQIVIFETNKKTNNQSEKKKQKPNIRQKQKKIWDQGPWNIGAS